MATWGLLLKRWRRRIWLGLRACLSVPRTRRQTSRPFVWQRVKITVSGANDTERLTALEGHYRPCACRSETPFFSERRGRATTSHRQEKEDRKPSCGLNEIRQYWRLNSAQQRHVKFEPLDIQTDGNKVTATWRCSFFRTDLNLWLRLNGHFEARVEGGKISDFRERYNKEFSRSPDFA